MTTRSALPLALAAIILAGGCGGGDEALPESGTAARSQAEAALDRGDRPGALEALARLRAEPPETPEALIELTHLMVRAGEAPEAGWLLEEGISRFPDRDELRIERARVALVVQDPSRARSVVEPIGRSSPVHFESLLLRARAELELGNLERGLALLAEAGQRHPERPEAGIAQVATLVQERRYDEARAAIGSLRGHSGLDEAGRHRLEIVAASLDASQGRTDDAVASLRERVGEEPLDPYTWSLLLPLLLRSEAREDALALLEAASAAHPEAPLPRALLAEVYRVLGRPDEARATLRKLVDDSGSASAHLALANFESARGEPGDGAAVLEEAVARHPDSPMLKMHLAEALIEGKRLEAAREATDAFRASAPRNLHIEYLEGRLELAGGDPEAATVRLQRLVSMLDSAYTQFWLGRALEAGGDLAGAQRRYGLAAARDPYNAVAPRAMLRIALERGDWQGSAAAARLVLARAPNDATAGEALVAALLRLGNATAAERISAQLIAAMPDRRETILLHARALGALGRHPEREKLLADAAARLGADASLETELALSIGFQGRSEEAIEKLRAIAATHPESAETWRALTLLYFAVDQPAEGSRAAERALALEPEEPIPLALRSRYYASKGEFGAARRDAEGYLALRPDAADMHFMLGFINQGAGETRAAIASYQRAAELDDGNFAARNNLALLLAGQEEIDRALVYAQEAYAVAGTNPDVIDTLGWLYLKKGLVDRAIAFLERARRDVPGHEEIELHLGIAYARAGRAEEARGLLTRIAQSDTTGPDAREQANAALRSLPR